MSPPNILDQLKFIEEDREKKAFYASDINRSNLDLYFGFKHEPKTNPPKWNDTLKWGAGNGVESSMLNILKMNNIVPKDYDQKEHGRIEIERAGVKIHGYIDAKTTSGLPIEIKSINNANKYDVLKYENQEPKENYVGQLCVYMDALDVDTGYLFVASIDGLHTFWFTCRRISGRVFTCGKVTINLDKEYERWANVYNEHVLKDVMPDLYQYVYKKDVNTLDWKSVSPSAISKARNNKAVIGDWQIQYSSWKNKIIKLQGATIGYTDEELKIIKEKTEGYTTWKKKKDIIIDDNELSD